MAKWTLSMARIQEETPYKLEIGATETIRRQRLILGAFLLVLGVGGLLLGVFGGELVLTLIAGGLCLVPALLLFLVVAVTEKAVIDERMRTITLVKVGALGINPLRQQREKTIQFPSVIQAEYKTDWMGSFHRVEISTREKLQIVLNFGNQEDEAKRAIGKLAEFFGPSIVSGISELDVADAPEVPVVWWRLALASIYGLFAALALGYVWSLIVTATSTKFAYAGLLFGLIVGIIVSFMAGGSKDVRYSIIGAVLSGVGIAFGEFLIFGLPDSAFMYEFDAIDILIYGLAVYEGWIIPRRSIPLVRRGTHLINDENRGGFLFIGVVALVIIVGITTLTGRLPTPGGTEAKVHYDKATTLADQGKLDEAIREYEEAIRIMPNYALAHNDLGVVYFDRWQLEEAEQEFKLAIESDPKLALAHANLANVYDTLGRYEEGMAEANEAVRLDPSLPIAHLVMGYLHSSLGDYDQAQLSYEKVIELDPSMPDPYFMLGLLHTDLANWGMAIEQFTQALDADLLPVDRSMVYAFRGMAYGAMFEFENGLADEDTAISLDAENAFAYYIRGLIHIDMGEDEFAINDLETALDKGLEGEARLDAQSYLAELK